ncbi:hypothetical protein SAMN05444003_0772 [Cognatiyoonia sediminum]|uniref:Uncharacterized protein n=1 Tax=Cognatiyoonia sediminum TaxID=1508389 RepID=A0A1M5MDI3_9RHOB|nr:hypothetical protein [Cognatiyoonia sediminum]SHG75271.1 hypothetical protein SAMN05444003_0772 [Cognatiyoonia sediminum]
MNTHYQRPTGSNATSVGDKNRRRWSRCLRSRVFELFKPIDFLNAEGSVVLNAIHKQMADHRRGRWNDRPSWVSTRIRTDQMAIINMLQSRHLNATGKEISKAEVLAALMAAGLETIINHRDFGGDAD